MRSKQALGYRVVLMFLALPSPEVAISRVAVRVRQGGHAVPDDVVRRRFFAGQRNFEQIYKPPVDTWGLYDSTGDSLVLIDWVET